MYDVIDVEFTTLWTKPVRLAARGRDDQMIRGPEEAIHFLSRGWPCERSSAYINAKAKCAAAVLHRVPIEASRAAFVTACLDARLVLEQV
ncbi:DUF982 domain-containing protein [Rhizobium tropici]|uniref:DUF982 domain-containing protein n=2 Tax=Rhizobium tropici TaxID=398 RepID=A0A6P1CD38_RHITR|nr:hypothetical protein RTCIAT899_PC09450 [Rhizobium tropici CIAT 899]MBB4245345.1 hypothetical protein [Rhizobium tropici]MBB5595790.1 hypothetical protein [Rhizobium tropici]MBB6495684.1 hypothetical protein [Rhizobium tropici]NEV15009.1 DUF982 domain-containing protein [Rhizobium tropici]